MGLSDFVFNGLALVGGLALFLYGMHVMGEGLTRVSGGRMEKILEKLTSSRLKGVLLGLVVTAVIQSSSATTVTVVGFVNSGIMKLSQAVGIIMGANIGTTVTSWLLSMTGIESENLFIQFLKPTSFTPVLAIIGILLIMNSKQEKKKDIGAILVGFTVLMYGMDRMSEAVGFLKDVPEFTNILTMFSNPILGMIAGMILTAIIQSSSASVGILQALCATGSMKFGAALPIIMGQNIGTCITALLSSAGATKNAKRAALVHLYFNLIGTTVFMIVFYSINAFVSFEFLTQTATPAGIAVIHSVFNVVATIVLLPFADGLEKLAVISIRDDREPETLDEFAKLDVRFLDTPALALEQCKNAVNDMAFMVKENIEEAISGLTNYSEAVMESVSKRENKIDLYEEKITEYIRKIGQQNLLDEDSLQMNMLTYCIRDFERISDHACNIAKQAEKIAKKGMELPKKVCADLNEYASNVNEIVRLTAFSFAEEDEKIAIRVEQLEGQIDDINKKFKKQTLKKVKKNKVLPELGIIVNELSINFERVADHCENIAISLLEQEETEVGGMLE